MRCGSGRDVMSQGPPRPKVSPAPPRNPRTGRKELYPKSFRPGHLMSRSRDPTGWSLRKGIPKEEPRFPRDRRRRTHEAPSALGLRTTDPSRKRPADVHPRCLPSMGGPKPGAVVHRLWPTCGISTRRLFHRRGIPRLSTCRGARRRDPARSAAKPSPCGVAASPIDFCDSVRPRLDEIGRAHV